jgi:CRISPR-associated protein Cas2
MAKMFIVVVYDISDDPRRTKLHNTLKNFGTPVQYSVFECILSKEGLKKMKAAVNRVIEEDTDLVRYYYICDACKKKIETTAGAKVTKERPVIVV